MVIQIKNYPKADLIPIEIKEEAIALAKALINEYHQDRIVEVCTDKTILLQKPNALDSKMKSWLNVQLDK